MIGQSPAKPFDAPWSVRDALLFAAAWLSVPVLIILALSLVSPWIAPVHHFLMNFKNNDLLTNFIFVLADSLLGFGLLYYYLKRYGVGWHSLGWRKFNLTRALAFLIGGLVVFGLAVGLSEALIKLLWPSFNPTQPQVNEFTKAAAVAGRDRIISFIALVVIPPFIEESVFRGFMFPAFTKRFGVVWGAVITSILFGLAHWQSNVSLYTMVLSLVLCLMYYRLRSIFPGIALHMLNNYLAFMVLLQK